MSFTDNFTLTPLANAHVAAPGRHLGRLSADRLSADQWLADQLLADPLLRLLSLRLLLLQLLLLQLLLLLVTGARWASEERWVPAGRWEVATVTATAVLSLAVTMLSQAATMLSSWTMTMLVPTTALEANVANTLKSARRAQQVANTYASAFVRM